MVALATPILRPENRVTATPSIHAPTQRFDVEKALKLFGAFRQASAELSCLIRNHAEDKGQRTNAATITFKPRCLPPLRFAALRFAQDFGSLQHSGSVECWLSESAAAATERRANARYEPFIPSVPIVRPIIATKNHYGHLNAVCRGN